MSECLICYDFIESRIFGFEKCYKDHAFCEECMVELLKRKKCPIDRIRNQNIVLISKPENNSVPLKTWTLRIKTLSFLKDIINKKKVIPFMCRTKQFSLDVCTNCTDDIKDQFQFRLEGCFQDHRLCYDCFLLHMYDVSLGVTKCFQEEKNTNLNIVVQRNGETVFLDQDRYEKIVRNIVEFAYTRGLNKSIVQDALWKRIKVTTPLSLDICKSCARDITYNIQCELECCFQDQRKCYDCFSYYMIEKFCKGSECPRHSAKVKSLTVVAHRKDKIAILNNYQFYSAQNKFIYYTDICDRSESTLQDTCWRLMTNRDSIDICWVCARDIKDNLQVELKCCFEVLRKCYDCFYDYMITAILIDNRCIRHYKPIDAFYIVAQNKGIIVILNINHFLVTWKTFICYTSVAGQDKLTFKDTFWQLITNPLSLDICRLCAVDIKDNIQIELEGCFENHRQCFTCFCLNINSFYKAQNSILNIVAQKNGETLHLGANNFITIVRNYKGFDDMPGKDEPTFQDKLWKIIKNDTFE